MAQKPNGDKHESRTTIKNGVPTTKVVPVVVVDGKVVPDTEQGVIN